MVSANSVQELNSPALPDIQQLIELVGHHAQRAPAIAELRLRSHGMFAQHAGHLHAPCDFVHGQAMHTMQHAFMSMPSRLQQHLLLQCFLLVN